MTFAEQQMPSVLIQNGTVVNADTTVKADLLIEGAVIKDVRAGIPTSAAETRRRCDGLVAAAGWHRRAHAS